MRTDYDARILADHINTATRDRLTTFELTFPRFVLAEFNTHRMLSRNSASSRAIPVRKRIAAVRAAPFVPAAFGANRRGMQAGVALDRQDQDQAREEWIAAAYMACGHAEQLAAIGVHKQWANRLIEPFCWHTVIASGTEWENFFALRCHPDAQPEIRIVAELARDLYRSQEPVELVPGGWHLPMLTSEELSTFSSVSTEQAGLYLDHLEEYRPDLLRWIKVAVGRCARVSYLTHDGRRDPDADVALCDRLVASGHMSPMEHAAMACTPYRASYRPTGNFRGWLQYRKLIPGEAIFGSAP